jgi:hypothetical protein
MEEGLVKVDREAPGTLADRDGKRYSPQLKTGYIRCEVLEKFIIRCMLYTLGAFSTNLDYLQ